MRNNHTIPLHPKRMESPYINLDEAMLIRRYKEGDRKALALIMEKHEGFIRKLSLSFNAPWLREDLLQAGRLALMESIDDYDEKIGTKLLTHAGPRIRYAMQEVMAGSGSVSASSATYRRMLKKDGNTEAFHAPYSICSPPPDDDDYREIIVKELTHMSAEKEAVNEMRLKNIRSAMERLPEEERKVLELRFGIHGREFNLIEIAMILDSTRAEISATLRRAKSHLRKIIEEGNQQFSIDDSFRGFSRS